MADTGMRVEHHEVRASRLSAVAPITVTTAGVELDAGGRQHVGYYIKADPNNAEAICIGGAQTNVKAPTSHGFRLYPGESMYIPGGVDCWAGSLTVNCTVYLTELLGPI